MVPPLMVVRVEVWSPLVAVFVMPGIVNVTTVPAGVDVRDESDTVITPPDSVTVSIG